MTDAKPFDRRSLSRALTRAANASAAEILADEAKAPDREARRIGVTGPPGAGKSSLIGRLVRRRLRDGRRLAIIAIDPSSPSSQGSILGDRLRMDELFDHPNLYIRSFPSRNAHDGLTDNLPEILAVLDHFGFDEVIVETVGVGQAEYGVRTFVDTELLVLVPEAGDQVQAMKCGIIETADIYVVNKADLNGAGKIAAAIRGVLHFDRNGRQDAPVLTVSASNDKSIDKLDAAIQAHLEGAVRGRDETVIRRLRRRARIENLIHRQLSELLARADPSEFDASLIEAHRKVTERLRASNNENTTGWVSN